MPGIYLHIPFCKQACHYCNFHFSTSLKYKSQMVDALVHELERRHDFLGNAALSSIYFGGGTPSLLNENELQQIFDKIYQLFKVEPDAEITLEANPDDLTKAKLQALRQTPINRLSIGIQSFSEEDLQFMNRAHNATEAKLCIEYALAAGFENLTVDLIYGSPTTSDARWAQNIQTVVDYGIPHVSCYALTVEPKTALDHFVKIGKAPPIDEEQAARQFEMLMQILRANGYEHYEISNFAKPGKYARHNSSYWTGEPYLGIGPAAHSFDGNRTRRWNVANNARYLKGVEDACPPLAEEDGKMGALEETWFEQEILTDAQRYDEYVMTALRTTWGAKLTKIETFGQPFAEYFLREVEPFLAQNLVVGQDDIYTLTDAGKLLADFIAAQLFWEE